MVLGSSRGHLGTCRTRYDWNVFNISDVSWSDQFYWCLDQVDPKFELFGSLIPTFESCFMLCWLLFRTGIAFDKGTHKSKFMGGQAERDYVRFYRYLQYAAKNTFDHLDAIIWDVLADLLDAWGQTAVLEWFVKTLVGAEGCWMLCHGGAGNCNHNNSVESHWR